MLWASCLPVGGFERRGAWWARLYLPSMRSLACAHSVSVRSGVRCARDAWVKGLETLGESTAGCEKETSFGRAKRVDARSVIKCSVGAFGV